MSELFSLNQTDFVKGLVVAVLGALATYLAAVLNVPGFELSSLDWQELLKIAFAAGMGYVGKNFMSDKSGKVLGKF